MTRTETGLGSSSSCYKVVRTKTAVFPIPLLAWQRTSTPRTLWGIHSCWTSEGCSKPQSVIAFMSSGLRRKSLNPVEWMPANCKWFLVIEGRDRVRQHDVTENLLLAIIVTFNRFPWSLSSSSISRQGRSSWNLLQAWGRRLRGDLGPRLDLLTLGDRSRLALALVASLGWLHVILFNLVGFAFIICNLTESV